MIKLEKFICYYFFAEQRCKMSEDAHGATLVWKPFEDITPEDESVIEGYLELACSPSVGHGGRNKELAIHFLHTLDGSVKVSQAYTISSFPLFSSLEKSALTLCNCYKLCLHGF